MASSTPTFTPTKRHGSTPWTYSWVKKPLSRSPGLLRTPPQRVPSAPAGPLVPPSTGGATAATVNTVGMGCEYSFVPERSEPGEQEEERPAWDSSIKDASIYRLPPEEMARRKARLQSPHNVFHRQQDKAKANNNKAAGKRAGASKAAFASSAPAAPFEQHPATAKTASPLRGGAGGRRRLAASLAAVSDDEGLITRRRQEQRQRRLLSASFSSATGTGRSQSAPRAARLSASVGAAPSAPAPSLSQSFVAPKGVRKQQQQQLLLLQKKPWAAKPQQSLSSSSLLGVVDLEEELAAFERRLQRAREDFDLPPTVAPSVLGGDGEEGVLVGIKGKGKGSKNKATATKGLTNTKKKQGSSSSGGGCVTAAIKPKPKPRPAPTPASEADQESEGEEEESEDLLLPFSSSAAFFSASAPAAAFVPPRLQARLAQSAEASAARRRGLSASTGSAPFSSASAKPPVGRTTTTAAATTSATAAIIKAAATGGGEDGKQDVGRAKSMGAPPAAQAAPPKQQAPGPASKAATAAAPVSAEEALLAAVLELDEQWEAGAEGGLESPLLANKTEAVALGRALEQWRQHQHEAGPATAAADMLLQLCARLLRRVGGLQQRNRGLEARVGKLEAQVGAFAVQLSALRGGGVGGVPLAPPRREQAAAVPVPSLHASRVAFEEEEEEEEEGVDEEERFRPLKKRLDELNASLLTAPAAPPAARSNKPAYHAVDMGLAAEEERQRVMAMMQDMFKQSAGSASGPVPPQGGKRLGQAKGPLVGVNKPQQQQEQEQQSGSVMEIGTWRRPGAWAGRSGGKAHVPN